MIDWHRLEIALYRSSHWIRVVIVLPALASMVAGCADSRIAGANAQASSENSRTQRPAPVQTGYGLSSDGPTTDLYTELFRSKDAPTAPSSATVAQGQPSTASPVTVAQGHSTTAASPAAVPQGQPAAAANAAQQIPAALQAPPATATVYGMSSDGPTTDLYTELFGARSRSQ
jgi:hypothetical protein